MRPSSFLTWLALVLGLASAAPAQENPFATAVTVNDQIVTYYEIAQRARFLELLQFPGDVQAEAEKGLIEDRLRVSVAKSRGFSVSDEEVRAGMAEFAARANLEVPALIQALGQEGVSEESFRSFVEAGILWRNLVRSRFQGQVVISDAEIDRALSAENGRGGGTRVLLSEIIMRARPGEVGRTRAIATKLAETLTSEAAFARAAEEYSLAPSRKDGGRVGWIPLSNLPPVAQGAISKLGQGQVSAPVPLSGYVALFLLRGMQEGADVSARSAATTYAQLVLPAGAEAEAARLRAEARICDDLYKLTDGGAVKMSTLPRGQIPANIAAELDRLDINETSAALRTDGGGIVLLMVCERTATRAPEYVGIAELPLPGPPPRAEDGDIVPSVIDGLGFGYGPQREQVREELTNQKMTQMAEAWMAELRADADITRP